MSATSRLCTRPTRDGGGRTRSSVVATRRDRSPGWSASHLRGGRVGAAVLAFVALAFGTAAAHADRGAERGGGGRAAGPLRPRRAHERARRLRRALRSDREHRAVAEPAHVRAVAARAGRAVADRRGLCVWLRNEASPTPGGRVCVVPNARMASGVGLRWTVLDHGGNRIGIRDLASTVRRPQPTLISTRFSPAQLRLVPGRYFWYVRSVSAGIEDRLPNSGELPLDIALSTAPAARARCFGAASRDSAPRVRERKASPRGRADARQGRRRTELAVHAAGDRAPRQPVRVRRAGRRRGRDDRARRRQPRVGLARGARERRPAPALARPVDHAHGLPVLAHVADARAREPPPAVPALEPAGAEVVRRASGGAHGLRRRPRGGRDRQPQQARRAVGEGRRLQGGMEVAAGVGPADRRDPRHATDRQRRERLRAQRDRAATATRAITARSRATRRCARTPPSSPRIGRAAGACASST